MPAEPQVHAEDVLIHLRSIQNRAEEEAHSINAIRSSLQHDALALLEKMKHSESEMANEIEAFKAKLEEFLSHLDEQSQTSTQLLQTSTDHAEAIKTLQADGAHLYEGITTFHNNAEGTLNEMVSLRGQSETELHTTVDSKEESKNVHNNILTIEQDSKEKLQIVEDHVSEAQNQRRVQDGFVADTETAKDATENVQESAQQIGQEIEKLYHYAQELIQEIEHLKETASHIAQTGGETAGTVVNFIAKGVGFVRKIFGF